MKKIQASTGTCGPVSFKWDAPLIPKASGRQTQALLEAGQAQGVSKLPDACGLGKATTVFSVGLVKGPQIPPSSSQAPKHPEKL